MRKYLHAILVLGVVTTERLPLILVAVMVILILLFSCKLLMVSLFVAPGGDPDRDLVPPGDCV